MGRKNRNPHPAHVDAPMDHFDVDYIFLPDSPDIAAVVVPQMKTIYRNASCAPWADQVHEVKSEHDKYLAMIRHMY